MGVCDAPSVWAVVAERWEAAALGVEPFSGVLQPQVKESAGQFSGKLRGIFGGPSLAACLVGS